MAAAAEISLVIPAYNEAKRLPRLLASVEVSRARHRGGRDAIEVIVSDNGSTDHTAALAEAAGCRVARVAKRRIGAVRNGGAARARGRILAFVDADLVLHPDTFDVISETLADGAYVGGGTGWRFERSSLGLALTGFVVRMLVARLLRIEERFRIGTPAPATVSTRKWDQHGDWHVFWMPFWPVLKRRSPRQLVDAYWYPTER